MSDTSKWEDMRIIDPHEGAASLAVHAADGRVLLAIHQDGTVTGAVEDASEAGARFVAYLRGHVFGRKKFKTLGDIAEALTDMKLDGMTRESIEYSLSRVYWEDQA